jgi:hypothetical protein
MKRWAKAVLRETSERIVDASPNVARIGAIDQATQVLLRLKYRELAASSLALATDLALLPSFADVEFRCFSQNGEDGILLYLFSLIRTTTRRCVEICCGNGIECNTANLIVNHGWTGLLIDGDEGSLREGRRFYKRCRDTWDYPPALVASWVTRANVNDLLATHGFGPGTEGIDLLSLDMDGIDYWVLEAMAVRPRAIVLEYNTEMGPERAVSVPYRDDFVSETPGHAGASLPAFVKLLRGRGYRLVGCQSYGFNAFFLRGDVGVQFFPEIRATDCFGHPKAQAALRRGAELARLDWVEV